MRHFSFSCGNPARPRPGENTESSETSSAVFSQDVIYFVGSSTFESVDEILWCYHSNEISSAVLSHDMGVIYFVGSSNF